MGNCACQVIVSLFFSALTDHYVIVILGLDRRLHREIRYMASNYTDYIVAEDRDREKNPWKRPSPGILFRVSVGYPFGILWIYLGCPEDILRAVVHAGYIEALNVLYSQFFLS